ncbi:MAG: hypothetical protein ACK415_08040 [Thermodesulfovibrionales bacterium]
MRLFDIKERVKETGEYILGLNDTGSHACYLIYGKMLPFEKGRQIKPGEGHEELFLAIKGDFSVTGDFTGIVREGQAIHIREEETCYIENLTDSTGIYVIAGGHSKVHH